MSTVSIATALRRYESIAYSCALRRDVKKETLDLLKDLNLLLKKTTALGDDRALQMVKQVSTETLELYLSSKAGKKMPIEQSLQWMSSRLFGGFYPPVGTLGTFVDSDKGLPNDEFHLSPEQEQLLEAWIQVEEQDWSETGLSNIYQDFLQDCSFVASLISLARCNSQELLERITPQLSHNKRFGVTLNFNGCKRLVEIDNRLPELRDKSLYIKSKSNPNLYWPALLEKAYLKIRGEGYEPKGSNANIDTFIISGWIPEFYTASENPSLSNLWETIAENFKNNRIVLNIGTGANSKEYFPNHDFSILNIDEDSQILLVKNPWSDSVSQVRFADIFDRFETLYINWNPEIFMSHKKKYLKWSVPEDSKTIFENPQYLIKNTSGRSSEVWVLLEKHLGFRESSISTVIYKTNGEKLFSKTQAFTKVPANNTGFHLSKIKLSVEEAATIVVFSDSQNLQNFTLHTYSTNEGLELTRAQLSMKHLIQIDDQWDLDSCGGNWSNNSYTKNPQYELFIPGDGEPAKTKICVFTDSDILVNYQLFWKDEMPFNDKQSSIITEKYRAGHMAREIQLKSDQTYKVVVSSYYPDVHAKFKLLINSEAPVEIKRISTRLGLYVKPFKFQWNNKNRFKLNLKVERETKVSIHLWSEHTYSEYRPKIRASLFYKSGEPIQVNSDFSDNLYGIWLQHVTLKSDHDIILLIERFEVGDDELFGEIGSDNKIEIL